VSLAIWDHTVLPATRHKWTHPALTPATQTGTRTGTHPSSNRAGCRATVFIKTNALTYTTPSPNYIQLLMHNDKIWRVKLFVKGVTGIKLLHEMALTAVSFRKSKKLATECVPPNRHVKCSLENYWPIVRLHTVRSAIGMTLSSVCLSVRRSVRLWGWVLGLNDTSCSKTVWTSEYYFTTFNLYTEPIPSSSAPLAP